MIETERLYYIHRQQHVLRCESYGNLRNQKAQETIDISIVGQRVILPSSFTGGVRYMLQNYLDAMSLCKWFGYPDFFITFTCNPKWPEVKRFLKDTSLQPEDRPDILCRLFKIKLDAFIKHLRENKIFGIVQAVVYTIEFQKQGVKLDNKNVVPDNKYLLKRYQAHINVEWCNQGSSIKYLFKYINKGPYRATVGIVRSNNDYHTNDAVDEINEYYDCRYLSACEESWRIFKYDVHYRYPSIVRLTFHLPGQQQIIYGEDDDTDDVLHKPYVASSMFTT
ncbi:uncharacterized protein LOC111881040 [Lactuca sativa]|uniref:uncharacterized protein LOC111881040 n=1 Tax=Lactuca sativa TaxID=4236 RepID=UPI000CD88A29|nr:uncharacterized protein LOC111881040 [Lactuca sativa]